MTDEIERHHPERTARLLRDRRTVHEFTGEVPPHDVLTQAIEVARWAPNHLRTEPWHFYVLDRASADRVVDLNTELVRGTKGDKVADIKHRRWSEMPGWLVVTCHTGDDAVREREDYAACCCAVHNMSLYLWAHGIGMKWTTGAVTREARFFEILGIDPSRETVVGLFWYGYPTTVPVQHRKAVDDVLTYVRSTR